jgi:rod shape-determining protein MreD
LGVAAFTALAMQTTVGLGAPSGFTVDLVLVLVVYIALTTGPAAGMLTGTALGLAQDALSGGVVGVGGLAKTLVGYGAGVLGAQFIVANPGPRFVVFFLASLGHAAAFIGFHTLLGLGEFPSPYRTALAQATANAVIGVVALQFVERLPGYLERRRVDRMYRRR